MVKKVALLLMLIALLATSLVVGCAGVPPAITAIDLVPQQANFVASIQISRILSDADLIAAYNEAAKGRDQPQTFDELLNQVEEATGIDPRDFSEAVIFGDTESLGESGAQYLGAIVTGTFDTEALIESIEQAIGEEMTTTDYKGYQIYSITIDSDEAALCFLSDDSFVCGSVAAVKDVIDVKEGAPCLSGPIAEAYDSLGDVWIKAAAEVPEEAMAQIPEAEIPIGLEAFWDVQVVGFGFNKVGQLLSAQLKLYFSSSASAADAETMINSLISFIPIMMPPGEIPPEVIALLDGLDVSRSGQWVTISLQTTVTEVQNLVEAMEEGL